MNDSQHQQNEQQNQPQHQQQLGNFLLGMTKTGLIEWRHNGNAMRSASINLSVTPDEIPVVEYASGSVRLTLEVPNLLNAIESQSETQLHQQEEPIPA